MKYVFLKYLKDLKMFDLKYVMGFYFEKGGIENRFLEVFDWEKIDGEVFVDFDMDDFDRFFKDMLYGDKKRFFNIKKFILKKELEEGLFFEIVLIFY